MIISIDWLKDFINIEETPEELSNMLSSLGLEAECDDQFGDIKDVVIGEVISVSDHPNADRLNLCVVSDGQKEFQVVCGAPNVAEGQIIAYAKVGSTLPGGFNLEKIKLRGVESNGMICSARELNISNEHDGILVLPESCILGANFIDEYANKFLKIELDITPNRPDAFSHYGVARDISVFKKRTLNPITIETKDTNNASTFNISISDQKDCPRYIGAIVNNVVVGPSPTWIQDRLIAAGQRPINNLVDISNYVLMEMGQPTHIFDWDKVSSDEILVRRANKNESITTLDQDSYKLNENNLLITDGDKPIAIAGVMGGFNSAVNEETKTIFIESAYFDPIVIRKSSKSLLLSTEASKRYERGADPQGALPAFWKIINLIEKYAGGSFDGDFLDLNYTDLNNESITIRSSEIEQILGASFEKDFIVEVLEGLGFTVKASKDNEFACIPPSYRPDIAREIDVIEELARMKGYDNIPTDDSLYGHYFIDETDPHFYLHRFRDKLSGLGFFQHYSNSLQDKKTSNLFSNNSISMLNPLSNKMAYLRTSLYPGLLKAAELNIKNSTNSLRLYELGNIHSQNGKKLGDMSEEIKLTAIILGDERINSVHHEKEDHDIFSIKGMLKQILSDSVFSKIDMVECKNELYEYGFSLDAEGMHIGTFGKISKKLFNLLKIGFTDAFGFDIDIENIKRSSGEKIYKSINSQPKISRRINLLLNDQDSIIGILKLIQEKGGANLIEHHPVEIFKDKESIGENKKSVVIEMIFQHKEKTLEDKDVNPIIDEIIDIAQTKFNAKLRV